MFYSQLNFNYKLQQKRLFIILLCISISLCGVTIPRAKAMDPVTIAILAPILLPYAIKIADYSFKGFIRTIPGWVQAGKQLLNILRIPLGMGQLLLGIPFGLLGHAIHNLVIGFMAPFMFMKEIIMLPVLFFGG